MQLLSVCSARPNFIKLAAVHHALKEGSFPGVSHVIVHTGQHFDPLFSDVFFEQLSLPQPAYNLGIHGGTREEAIERTREAMLPLLAEAKPDIVLLYGDVNGAAGAALACREAGVPVAHVEAGLRSFDASMPEEHNRILIDQIADVLLCTEEAGVQNLQKEGVAGHIELTGNTMIDTLVRMQPLIAACPMPVEVSSPFAVCTLHRPSNVDDADMLRANLRFLSEVAAHLPVVLPVHHRLGASIKNFGLEGEIGPDIRLIEPLGYVPFLKLVSESAFILTDSGGIQEEATFLKKRCFTLRLNTERPCTIESGSNILIDILSNEDRAAVLAFAEHPVQPDVVVPALWDGRAGKRILEVLTQMQA